MLFHPMSWGTQELLLLAVIILIVLQAIILRRLLAPSPPPSLPPPTRPPLTPLPLPPVLPRPRPEEAEDESPSSSPRPLRYRAPPQAPYQVVTGQGSVLVVDDNEINQLLFRKMLQRYKFQVDIAADGEQALMRLRAKPYAAVFLDLAMPVMDGAQAARLMRTLPQHARTPIVLVSAHLAQVPLDSLDVAATLSKPIQVAEFDTTLLRLGLIEPV